jgi:CubicO group peptidase (beta-lactamase class C family)
MEEQNEGGHEVMSTIEWSDFEAYVKQLMEDEHIPGAAIAVSHNGQVIYQKGFGFRDYETQEPVTPDTIFGVASITKSFTALAIMQLEQEGKLSVDDPVIQYLPEFKLHGIEHMERVNIRHLLSHTTGLPPMRRREDLTRLDYHLEYLATEKVQWLGRPGEYFSYCNDTFLLLGAIIERITGRLYRRYMTERLLDPLEMFRSTFSLEEVEKLQNVSVPYVYHRELDRLRKVPWPKLGNYEVGGGVRSTVLDLIKYGQIYVGDEAERGKLKVDHDRVKNMWKPVHSIGRKAYYGYALRVQPDYCDMTLVEHGGGQPGVSSNFGFVPEKDLVVAVLTNVTGVSAGDLWLAAVNAALGLPLTEKRNIEPVYEASLEELKKFIGNYHSAEGGKINIFAEGETLKAESDGQVYDLRPSDDRTLVMIKNEKPITFFFDENEIPWALFFGMRMLTRI